jgi:sugar (pentulose or hexulose) kinase
MDNILLLDFGASRVKSIIADLDTGNFCAYNEYASPQNISDKTGKFEVSLSDFKRLFLAICSNYYNKQQIHFNAIQISSQMHGFIVLDNLNRPRTNYISWKDERSLTILNKKDTYSYAREHLGSEFEKVTGMFLRPGLPITNIAHLCRLSDIPKQIRVITLPEWLSMSCNDFDFYVHATMLAGTGFYDIRKRKVSEEMVNFVKDIRSNNIIFSSEVPAGAIAGYWHNRGRKIPICVGIGDHQCAVLGAGNIPDKTISINIGTGSQVSIIDGYGNAKNIELRPYFGSSILRTITHIPAGRVLSKFIDFLNEACGYSGNKKFDFWDVLEKVDENDIINADWDVDLGLFKSAWNFKNGGAIRNITEGNFTVRNYIDSLVRALGMQYIAAIKHLNPNRNIRTCILSGGIPKKLPHLTRIIAVLLHCRVISPAKIDETFMGLRSIALMARDDSENNYLKAQNFFGRKATLCR